MPRVFGMLRTNYIILPPFYRNIISSWNSYITMWHFNFYPVWKLGSIYYTCYLKSPQVAVAISANMLSPLQVLLHHEPPKLATDVFLVWCMLTVVSPKFLLVVSQEHPAFAYRMPTPSERNYVLCFDLDFQSWYIPLISSWMSLYLGHWQ